MSKPPLLYASPFPPQQSGISEYSRVLVRGLSEFFTVTLYTEDYQIADQQLAQDFPVEVYRKNDWDVLDRYPYKLYNIGNNPWYHGYIYKCCLRSPGVVILHDAILYYLVVGIYQDRPEFLDRVYAMEGPRGVAIFKDLLRAGERLLEYRDAERLPLLGELMNSKNRFLVHSDYARQLVERHSGHVAAAKVVNHVDLRADGVAPCDRATVLARVGLPADALVVSSFGFVARTKQNHVVCEAIRHVNARGGAPLHYVMVGEGSYVDDELDEFIHKTGFVSEREFDEYLSCSDLVVSLRYPSMGETSGALLRAMSLGKPCIVTNHAWFSELPDSVVLKTDIPTRGDVAGQLTRAFTQFVHDRRQLTRMGKAAAEYITRYHGVPAVASQIAGTVLAGASTSLR